MGRRGYPAEFRRRVLDLVEAGRRVAEVAQDLGITEQTIYNWRRQDRIDRGLEAGLSTAERGELAAVRKRIRELEVELVQTKESLQLAVGKAEITEQDREELARMRSREQARKEYLARMKRGKKRRR